MLPIVAKRSLNFVICGKLKIKMVGRRGKRNLKDDDDKEVKKLKSDSDIDDENDASKKVDEIQTEEEDEVENDSPPIKRDKQEQEKEDNEQLVEDSHLESQSEAIKKEIEKVKISPVAEKKDDEHDDDDNHNNDNTSDSNDDDKDIEETEVAETLEADEIINDLNKDSEKQEEDEDNNEVEEEFVEVNNNDEEKEPIEISGQRFEGFSYAEASGVNQESSHVPVIHANLDNLYPPSSSGNSTSSVDAYAGTDHRNNYNNETINDSMLIPADKVGAVIGSKGGVIRDLSMKTGCKVKLHQDQDAPTGEPKPLVLSGTKEQIIEAKRLVNKVLVEGPAAMHNALALSNTSAINATIDCPPTVVGRLIGPNGSAIKELQVKSGARIFINQNVPDGADRKVLITGSQQAVDLAISLCHTVMQNGIQAITGHGQHNMSGRNQSYGARNAGHYGPNDGSGNGSGGQQFYPAAAAMAAHTQTQIIDCPRNLVGRLIGKGGESIKLIQSRSGCRMRIEQNVPEGTPCRIHVTGIPPAIALASQIIQEVMVNGTNRIVSMPIPNFHGAMSGPGSAPGFAHMVNGPSQFMSQPGMPMGIPIGMHPGPVGHPQMMPGMVGGLGMPMNIGVSPGMNSMSMNPVQMMANQHMTQHHHHHQQQQQQQQQLGDPSGENHRLKGGSGSVWSQHRTDTGKVYWHNAATGVSTWTPPE